MLKILIDFSGLKEYELFTGISVTHVTSASQTSAMLTHKQMRKCILNQIGGVR